MDLEPTEPPPMDREGHADSSRTRTGRHGADHDLEDLVGRTEGLQPWRRVFHAANGVAVAVALQGLDLSRWEAVGILTGVSLLLLASDLVRHLYPATNALFFRVFRRLASPREASGIASSTWYTLGLTLTVLLFPREHAVSGILVMALADPTGSYLGQRWGRRPFLGGTALGSGSFAIVALVVLAMHHPVLVALAGSLCATMAERRSWPVDDNLAVPVVTAAVTTWVTTLL